MASPRTLLTGAVAALVLTGCSGESLGSVVASKASTARFESLTPRGLANEAVRQLEQAKSFHLSGDISSDGETIKLDLALAEHGASGTIGNSGEIVGVLSTNGKFYLKAPASLYERELAGKPNLPAVLALIADKWVKIPSCSSDLKSFAGFADKKSFITQLHDDGIKDEVTSAPGKVVDGVDTVAFRSVATNSSDSDSVVYVSKQDGRPVRIEPVPKPGSTDAGALTFSQYDAVPEPEVPPADQLIDVDNRVCT